MRHLIPIIAIFGLVVVASLPAPGVLGVAVGGTCVLVIVGWAITASLSSFADFVLAQMARRRNERKQQFHAGSGVAKKVR